jgi:hypothetical protein
MVRYLKTILLMVLVLSASCGRRAEQGRVDAEVRKTREFPMPTPPSMMEDPGEIFEYMAMHYWNQFVPDTKDSDASQYLCDSSHVSGVSKGVLEQSLANYIYILENIPLKQAQKAVSSLAGRLQSHESADTVSNMFETFVTLMEKYMFDPNSPLRNEDLYSPFAAALSQSPHLDEATRDRYRHIAAMCRLNETGTKAADFRFSDKRGKEYSLYGIKADNVILFFSNPGCKSCLDIINSLKENPKVSQMLADGTLAVLNIYIDEDLQAWKKYMPVYPEEWYNGFDPDLVIRTDKIYNVRAIPSLYLLDADKTVLLKDATPEKLFNILDIL